MEQRRMGFIPRGTEQQLTLLTSTDNVDKLAVAEYPGPSLTQTGFAVTLEQLPWEESIRRPWSRGRLISTWGRCALTADFDPTALLSRTGR
ncbi:MAG: hypothetical protein ACLRWQ_16840 [Flavonifractor plautii]